MSKGYSEDPLVEQPAIELLAGLGWRTMGAFDEVFGEGGTLGRDRMGEVVLLRHLVPALKKLNPKAPAASASWRAAVGAGRPAPAPPARVTRRPGPAPGGWPIWASSRRPW